jgi:hypothetical protein
MLFDSPVARLLVSDRAEPYTQDSRHSSQCSLFVKPAAMRAKEKQMKVLEEALGCQTSQNDILQTNEGQEVSHDAGRQSLNIAMLWIYLDFIPIHSFLQLTHGGIEMWKDGLRIK